jgi:uncharacterized protein YkwD
MGHDVHRRRRRLTIAVGAAVASTALLPGSTSAAAPAGCAGANEARTLLCLVNAERRGAGLAPLRRDRRIARAARRHARDMVRRDFFAHQRAGGPDLGARLARAGWRGSAWGEAIAYGCGASGAPRAVVRSWLASPPHRAILLGAGYRRAGVGAAGKTCATWVLDTGRRS